MAGDSDPVVEVADVIVDTARRAPLRLEVRGSGTLVPEQLRWIAAPTSARVDRVAVQSGTAVLAGEELLRLVNPDVEIQSLQAEQQLSQAEAALMDLRLGLRQQALSQEGAVATLHTQWQDATQQATAAESLLVKDLISRFDAMNRRTLAAELTTRMRIEQGRLALLRTAGSFLATTPVMLAVRVSMVTCCPTNTSLACDSATRSTALSRPGCTTFASMVPSVTHCPGCTFRSCTTPSSGVRTCSAPSRVC